MTIQSEKDIQALLKIGRIVALTMQTMAEALKPGITTKELDIIGAKVLAQHGARSAPIMTYDYPGATCISINEEVAHGIPSTTRIIQPGDMVNIDVCGELNGYIADTGSTFPVPPVSIENQKLCDAAKRALSLGIEAARVGNHLHAIGRAVETEANKGGFRIIRQLGGHGVGRKLHEKPSIPNYFTKRAKEKIEPGMVFTIEPFFTTGVGKIETADDGWTLYTEPGTRSAQYEHTVIITDGRPILVTSLAS